MLSEQTRFFLEQAALFVTGKSHINPRGLRDLAYGDEAVAQAVANYLAEEVVLLDETMTVRRSSEDIFKSPLKDDRMFFMALCPPDTPSGVVTIIAPGVTPFMLRARPNAILFDGL